MLWVSTCLHLKKVSSWWSRNMICYSKQNEITFFRHTQSQNISGAIQTSLHFNKLLSWWNRNMLWYSKQNGITFIRYTQSQYISQNISGGRRVRDRMVVGFTTTYAISAYHHWCEFESRSWRGAQHYVITFFGDLRQVGGFLCVLQFPSPIKLKYCWKWR